MSSGKVCGEVRLRLSEFWDLPVGAGRSCFYTVECGNDCYYRSGCFQTDQEKDYESPVTVAQIARKEDANDVPAAGVDIEWRDKPGTIRFFLRGRVSQGVRVQVWQVPKDTLPWTHESSAAGLLPKDELFRGVPLGSTCLCRLSFPADSLRLSKGEYAGWLAMYPQGCVFLRLLQRRKVGTVELLRLNILGCATVGVIKMTSTRSAEGASGGLVRGITRSSTRELNQAQTAPTAAATSPWRDVASTGFTPESIDFLIDSIAKADRELAAPLVQGLLRGYLLPCSFVRIMAVGMACGGILLARDAAEFTEVANTLNLFVILLLSLGAVRSVRSCGDGKGVSGEADDEENYGEVIAERKSIRPLAVALASDSKMVTSGRGGLAVSLLVVAAVVLQTLVDVSRFFRSPRTCWRSVAVVALAWSVPWTFPKIWRVFARVAVVLLVGSLTPTEFFRRLLANALGGVLVLSSRQRQCVMEPLYWVNRNIPKGWSGRRAVVSTESLDDDEKL